MLNINFRKHGKRVLVIAAMFVAAPIYADKPDSASGGKGGKQDRKDRYGHHEGKVREGDAKSSHAREGSRIAVGGFFEDRHRALVRDYYAAQFRAGRCPPGLAKKHNGCQPPGQAKKWMMGHPLPRDVIYYDLPGSVARQFGVPPAGYRYARVANDILLISIGTGLVMDAIRDLGGLS